STRRGDDLDRPGACYRITSHRGVADATGEELHRSLVSVEPGWRGGRHPLARAVDGIPSRRRHRARVVRPCRILIQGDAPVTKRKTKSVASEELWSKRVRGLIHRCNGHKRVSYRATWADPLSTKSPLRGWRWHANGGPPSERIATGNPN